jgi:hypothetical protein
MRWLMCWLDRVSYRLIRSSALYSWLHLGNCVLWTFEWMNRANLDLKKTDLTDGPRIPSCQLPSSPSPRIAEYVVLPLGLGHPLLHSISHLISYFSIRVQNGRKVDPWMLGLRSINPVSSYFAGWTFPLLFPLLNPLSRKFSCNFLWCYHIPTEPCICSHATVRKKVSRSPRNLVAHTFWTRSNSHISDQIMKNKNPTFISIQTRRIRVLQVKSSQRSWSSIYGEY